MDIEETIADEEIQGKKLEQILDKTRYAWV